MPQIEIDDVGSIGIIRDQPAYQLPPEAWSDGGNVRIIEKSIGRTQGHTQVFGALSQVNPTYAVYLSDGTQIYWIYETAPGGSWVVSGGVHTNLIGGFSPATPKDMNGTILGGIPIINNGIDVPRYWPYPYSVANPLSAVTNWPNGGGDILRARVVRSFGPYLLALNCTINGTLFPNRFRWSHPADPGTLPSTWTLTDPSKDSGQIDFPDVESGVILDGLPLAGRFFVYKENATWRLRLVGGRKIFDEDTFLDSIGILATRCVAMTSDGKKHIFAGQDNIWIQDANNAIPLLDDKHKRSLFSRINPAALNTCFMFTNPVRDESWFCFPEAGQTTPTRALIINTKTSQITESDVTWVAAANGVIQVDPGITWAAQTLTWDVDPAPWSSTSGARRTILVDSANSKLNQLDLGSGYNGVQFNGFVQRTGLAVVGRKRNGDWIEDFTQRKLVTRVWPKVTMQGGGTMSIRVGSHDLPNGAVHWHPSVTFDPATQNYVDIFPVEGAGIAIEFSGSSLWKLDGYKLDMELTGMF